MNIFTLYFIKLIKFIQFFDKSFTWEIHVRYLPTCSEYSIEALKTLVFLKVFF